MTIDRKSMRRRELKRLLGELPDARGRVTSVLLDRTEREGYVLEKLSLDLNGIELAPAYWLRPAGSEGKQLPAVLFNHSHGGIHGIGKEELLQERGKGYLLAPSYAQLLTSLGYAVLCFDAWGFGERCTRSESEIFKQMLWNGQVMWGMMVYDSMRAVDYLSAKEDVDAARIGTLGISMGGTMAWWLAALDERVRYCVDLCSLADYDELIRERSLDRHGIYYYVPSLLKHFTAGQINGLIVPRPHLSLAGEHDALVPLGGLCKIDRELRRLYAEEGAESAWRLVLEPCGHEETPRMRAVITEFLLKQRDKLA